MIRELDDETLVYDTERDKAHCLNRTAALVWEQCDGKTTAREAARSLGSEFSVSVDEDVVWLAVKQLERFHLIEPGPKSSSVSRRDLVLKYAPAALALPVIMSITAPTPAGVSSCGGQGAPCGGANPPCCPGCSCDGSCFCGGA
ncbi:MAG TPA: PqqD family protein [Pyrinomonadaceae bacterium]|nr:PqqD family protein [Pyrinomonadaceae bacterium]